MVTAVPALSIVYSSLPLTIACPVPVFQEKLKILLFTHFTTYHYVYTVFTINELGITSQ